jgi:ubiquinone/menaquinone biosynthesis C-methylase UbiE
MNPDQSVADRASALTDRQQREFDYHERFAVRYGAVPLAVSYDIVENPRRKWWNAEWEMYTRLLQESVSGKRVLVVGCGVGDDAFYLARAGADVDAFDLSPDLLAVAETTARTERLAIRFTTMTAESLDYPDRSFDCVVARDILHHVDIPQCLSEVLRVMKPGALFAADEVYAHSVLRSTRYSWLVERVIYPRMVRRIYQTDQPYITQDERQMDERDVARVAGMLANVSTDYFNCINARFYPPTSVPLMKFDRRLLSTNRRLAAVLGGRVLITGRKPETA